MRLKFSSAFILAFTALSALTVSAQTWQRIERDDKQKRKQTTVHTIDGRSEIIVTTPDEIIVRPALRAPNPPRAPRVVVARPAAPPRTGIVRITPPVPPVPPVRIVERNNYSRNRNVTVYSSRDYENNRYESNRYDNVAQVARLNGYRDGLREGAKDARDGDRYDPFGEHDYKDGATGYISKYGNRKAYQQSYRQSFVRGYKESFDRYLGNDKRYW